MKPVTINLTTSSGQLLNTAGCVTWITSKETSGTATAAFNLWDGDSNAGTLIAAFTLAANESTRDFTGEHHLTFKTGLYLEVVSGAIEGSVAALVEHQCEMVWQARLHEAIEHALGG